MHNRNRISLIVLMIVLVFGFAEASCHRGADELEPLQQAGISSTPPAAGAPAASQAGTPQAVAPEIAQVTEKTPTVMQGEAQFSKVVSKSPCKTDSDCTFSKYANAPKAKKDCTCQAPCEPFVVNVAEKNTRDTANKSLCGNDDWFGPGCPAPSCKFIEFDKFSCVEGVCVGIDLDMK